MADKSPQRRCHICRNRIRVGDTVWHGVTIAGCDSWAHDDCYKLRKKNRRENANQA